MAARWVDLLHRVHNVLDDADADLDHGDRAIFYTHVIAHATRRTAHTVPRPLPHPLPSGDPLYNRDPTGDHEDLV